MSNLKINKKGTKAIRKKMADTKKVKITINFDAYVLEEIKRMTKNMGSQYQTLLNKIVRDSIAEKHSKETRLDRIEKYL